MITNGLRLKYYYVKVGLYSYNRATFCLPGVSILFSKIYTTESSILSKSFTETFNLKQDDC